MKRATINWNLVTAYVAKTNDELLELCINAENMVQNAETKTQRAIYSEYARTIVFVLGLKKVVKKI